jgi:peptidoglycan/LPS O-acetylase OafA/YrhL
MALGLLVVAVRHDLVPRVGGLLRQLGGAPWSAWALAAGLFLVSTTPVAGPKTLNAFPSSGQAVTKAVLYGAVAVLLVLPATFGSGTRAHRMLTSVPAGWLGRVSYGIFLWHLVVLSVVMRALGLSFGGGHFWSVLGLTLALSVAVAWFSWIAVERPAQRLRHRVR